MIKWVSFFVDLECVCYPTNETEYYIKRVKGKDGMCTEPIKNSWMHLFDLYAKNWICSY